MLHRGFKLEKKVSVFFLKPLETVNKNQLNEAKKAVCPRKRFKTFFEKKFSL